MSAAVIDFPRDRLAQARPPRPVLHLVTAHREDDHAELVAAVLLAIEAAPLTPVLCYPARAIGGTGQVQVNVGEIVFALRPDDCLSAATALLYERGGEPGVLQTAASLREAAGIANARAPHGGPLAQPTSHRMGTGMVSTLGIAAVVLIAVTLETVARAF